MAGTILTRQVTVQTVDRSGTQGTRTVTMSLSKPNNCSIAVGGGASSVDLGDRTITAVTPLNVFINPFDRASAHHRRIGSEAFWQIMRGIPFTNDPSDKVAYQTNVGPVFKKGDISPMVKHYPEVTAEGLLNTGQFGVLSVKLGGAQRVKAFYLVEPKSDTYDMVTVITENTGNINCPIPKKDYWGDPEFPNQDKYPIGDGSGGGDFNFIVYPVKADASNIPVDDIYGYALWFIDFGFNGTNYVAARGKKWKITGLDHDANFNNEGAGGSSMFWPYGFQRIRDYKPTLLSNAGHCFNCTATRKAGPANAKAIMISRGAVWPACARDGSIGTGDNSGWLPYGGLLSIPNWFDASVRDSTDSNPVTIAGYSAPFKLNLTALGKALFNTLQAFGVRVNDGSGHAVGSNNEYTRMILRPDQAIAGPNRTGLLNELEQELDKIAPSITGAGKVASRREQCLLFPIGNIRPYTADTDKSGTDWFIGGGSNRYGTPNTSIPDLGP